VIQIAVVARRLYIGDSGYRLRKNEVHMQTGAARMKIVPNRDCALYQTLLPLDDDAAIRSKCPIVANIGSFRLSQY
jgi:hypothetical protein